MIAAMLWYINNGESVLNPPVYAFNRHVCSGHSVSRSQDVEHRWRDSSPQCFHQWINQDMNEVNRRFRALLQVDQLWRKPPSLSSSSHNSSGSSSSSRRSYSGSSDECLTSYLSVENNRILHHIPHFAEAYFGYFSTLLWQRRIYQYYNRNGNDEIDNTLRCHTSSVSSSSCSDHRNYTCVRTLLISDHSPFWEAPLDTHSWMRNMVDSVDNYLGIQSIQSPKCLARKTHAPIKFLLSNARQETWFLHPSDSLMLTSIILKRSPCLYRNQAVALLQEPITIALIGRSGTRRFMNEPETMAFLQSLSTNSFELTYPSGEQRAVVIQVLTSWSSDVPITIKNSSKVFTANHDMLLSGPSVMLNSTEPNQQQLRSLSNVKPVPQKAIHFEKLTFRQQVAMMHSVDVAIAVHGAGETNIAFMKPCSVVIEIFPNGFYIPNYFRSLAMKAGLLHYSWQESVENTIRTKSFQERSYCKDIITDLYHKRFQLQLNHSDPSNTNQNYHERIQLQTPSKTTTVENPMDKDHDEQLLFACFQNGKCRSCAREADGVLVNHAILRSILQQAIQDRINCIAEHPYYADTSEA